jgi:hypothetical protein
MKISHHNTREAWLRAAIEAVRPLFTKQGFNIPDCQVSCGFASTGTRSGHIGQCWAKSWSEDSRNHIFISPSLAEPVDVLDTLVHELIHAVDDCQHKRGKEFKKMALKLGMKGPMRSAGAGPELRAKLAELATELGAYPHGKLRVSVVRRNLASRPRAVCAECGFTVPMLKKFLVIGPPICPVDKISMTEHGDWEA